MKRVIFTTLACIFTLGIGFAAERHTLQYAEKNGEKLLLDHYPAVGVEGLRPCVIFAFGGGFVRGDRAHKDYASYFESLTAAGYDVVSIDYRLGLKNPPSDIGLRDVIALMKRSVDYAAEDLMSATRFVLDHAAEWSIDPAKIVVSGSSAGAIATLQAENYICNGDRRAKEILGDYNFAGVVSMAGAVFSVGGRPKWNGETCPIMMFHGSSDRNVPYNKASIFGIGFYGSKLVAKQLRRRGGAYWFHSAKYRSHIIAEEPMTRNIGEIIDFIEKCVKGGEHLQVVTEVTDCNIEKQPTRFSVKEYLSANYSRK